MDGPAHTPQPLLRTLLLRGLSASSLLAAVVLSTYVIFFVGIVAGGPIGGWIAWMCATTAMFGFVVGAPLAAAGVFLLDIERLRSLPFQVVTALLVGGTASALAWLAMVSPYSPSPVVLPQFFIGASGALALSGVFRISRLRSPLGLGIIVGLAMAASAPFLESAGLQGTQGKISLLLVTLPVGAALGAVWGWIYGFPARWIADLEAARAADASMTAEEREQFRSRWERTGMETGWGWQYVPLVVVVLIGVGLFVFRDRLNPDRSPMRIGQVIALQYDKDALSTSFVLVDSLGRETRAPGRALIDIRQGTVSDTSTDVSSGVLHTVYETSRDVDKHDYRTAELLLGGHRLECSLGRIAYDEIDRWHDLQRGRAPRLDTGRSGEVGVRFVTSSGDTLGRESYPFPSLWPRGSK